jgi:P27 family predicted phage terminase small subunit
MPKAGRTPKRAAIKIAEGNPGKRKIKKELEFEPLSEAPEPPSYLSEDAKAIFRRLAALLVSKKLLTQADLETLSAYVDACDLFIKSTKEIQEKGTTLVTKSGYEQIRPCFTVWKKALEEMRKWGTELGFTPLSRLKLQIEPVENEEDPLGIFSSNE